MRKLVEATIKERGSRTRSTRLWAPVCALALVALAAGNVAGAPLDRDNKGRAQTRLWIGVSPHVVAKLGTKAGYEVLVFG